MIMKKIYGVVALVAMLMGATLLLERTVKVAAAAPIGIKNVVLVHGAFADGSGWEAVAKILEKDGYTGSAAQPPESHYMAISQVPISTDSFTHKVTNPAWKTKPSWYMVATADRSINPDQERMMAKRANAKTVEVNASHVAYMSHPKETAKLIEEAASSISSK